MKKIRWALIGVGAFSPVRGGVNAIAYAHAEAIKRNSDSFELVAACSLIQKNLDDFAAEYPCNTYLDMLELFEKEKPDGVTISTYAAAREEHVIAAIHAGVKFILIEKPLALSLKAISHMESEAKKYGTRLFVNFQRRYGAPFQWAKETVASGKIGKVFHIELRQPCSNSLDFGPHFINSALFFIGEKMPVSLTASADGMHEVPWHGMMTEKSMEASMIFADQLKINYTASQDNSPDLPVIRINGEKGFAELYMNKPEGMKSVFCCGNASGIENPESSENFHHGDEDRFLYFEYCYKGLARAIQTGESSLVDLEYGIRTQRILLAMYASAQTHRRIVFGENEIEPEFRFL